MIHEELQWSVVEWPYQLLVRPADDLVELYDLERDPAQRDDLVDAATPTSSVGCGRATRRLRGVRVDRTLADDAGENAKRNRRRAVRRDEQQRRHPRGEPRHDRRDLGAEHRRPRAGTR